jgi:hypothetical protein
MSCQSRIGSLFLFCGVICCGLVLSRDAIAQKDAATLTDEDLISILRRMHTNIVANDRIAQQFACDDFVQKSFFNRKGKKLGDYTEKFESLFVDGLPYIHKVEENGRSLSAQKLVSEQKHQDALSELGKGFDFVFDLRDGNPHDNIYSALPICCLAGLFENHVLRHEMVDGRDTLVVESLPKASQGAASPVDRTSLDWKETTWIDLDDLMPARIEAVLLNDKGFLLKGTTEQREFLRWQDPSDKNGSPPQTVWLWRRTLAHSILKFLLNLQFQTFEDTSYNFKRFKAHIHMLPNSVQEIPHQNATPGP